MFRMIKSVALVAVMIVASYSADAAANNPLLGKDVHAAKKEIVSSNIRISDAKKNARFWEIYAAYEKSSAVETKAYSSFLEKFSSFSAVMTTDAADALAKELLRIQATRAKLLATVYKQIRKEISAPVASRFLMIENRISLLEDFQAISANPLALPEGERVIEFTVE